MEYADKRVDHPLLALMGSGSGIHVCMLVRELETSAAGVLVQGGQQHVCCDLWENVRLHSCGQGHVF